jgi:creatinine amidohydrolase
MNYEELLPAEFEAAIKSAPVAYLPWGALKWHGRHLALGLDSLKAHAIAQRVARRSGGVVLPPVWCGHNTMKEYGGFPLTLEFKRATVMQLLTEYLEQLSDIGFRLVVVVCGHYGPPHLAALIEAATAFTIWQPQRNTRVWVLPDFDPVTDLGYHGDHAARWETSVLMALRPELVDLGRLDDTTAGAAGGILGEDPRTASAPQGAAILDAIVERWSERVTRFLTAGHE